MTVTALDFLGIPTQDADRARTFYRDVLGLRPDNHAEYESWAGDTCFSHWEPKRMGMEFVAIRGNPIPLRVDDVHQARADLEAKGVDFPGDTFDRASATRRSSPTPTATSSCSTAATRRTATGTSN